MAGDSHIEFSTIDDRLLDGLDFCGRVYDLFDKITREPDGKSRLRLRYSKIDKRLVEELLPLANYIQVRYQAGRRVKVRWRSGSQQYDAILWSSGSLVDHGGAPRKVFVEVTTAVHQNDYLVRQLLDQSGGSFGPKGTRREGKNIISKPWVWSGGENARDLAKQILDRLRAKADKSNPSATVLVVNCVPACSLLLDDEWRAAIDQVRTAMPTIPFREVFLLDMLRSNTATLYGLGKRSPLRKLRETYR